MKALVPFPDVLEMMSPETGLDREGRQCVPRPAADVMDTVQRLRKRAHDAGSLKSTEQQKVIVEQDVIRVEPSSPSIVYVPVYDPCGSTGPWGWPAYPPYVVYPYARRRGDRAGVHLVRHGSFRRGLLGASWGYWGWHKSHLLREPPLFPRRLRQLRGTGEGPWEGAWATRQQGAPGASGAAGGVAAAQPWRHDPAHRRGVAYRDTATGERFGRTNRAAVENRRSFRGHEASGTGRTAGAEGPAMSTRGAARPDPSIVREALSARAGKEDAPMARSGRSDAPVRNGALSSRAGRADAVFSRAGRPGRDGARSGGRRRARKGGLTGRSWSAASRGGPSRESGGAERSAGRAPGAAGASMPHEPAAAGPVMPSAASRRKERQRVASSGTCRRAAHGSAVPSAACRMGGRAGDASAASRREAAARGRLLPGRPPVGLANPSGWPCKAVSRTESPSPGGAFCAENDSGTRYLSASPTGRPSCGSLPSQRPPLFRACDPFLELADLLDQRAWSRAWASAIICWMRPSRSFVAAFDFAGARS